MPFLLFPLSLDTALKRDNHSCKYDPQWSEIRKSFKNAELSSPQFRVLWQLRSTPAPLDAGHSDNCRASCHTTTKYSPTLHAKQTGCCCKGTGSAQNSLTPMCSTHTLPAKPTGVSFHSRGVRFPHTLPLPLLFLPPKSKLKHTTKHAPERCTCVRCTPLPHTVHWKSLSQELRLVRRMCAGKPAGGWAALCSRVLFSVVRPCRGWVALCAGICFMLNEILLDSLEMKVLLHRKGTRN